MELVLENGLIQFVSFLAIIFWLFYWYLTKYYDYWYKRGVPYKYPEFPFGSTKEILLTRTYVGKGHDDIYNTFPNQRFYGIIDFRTPALVIKDPELLKRVMVKDFQHFVNRSRIIGNPKEFINHHLLNLTGKEWKETRSKLTPTFTSGKIKGMFELMAGCSEVLKDKLDRDIKEKKVIDAKDLLARFTMDIIASCAFGLEGNNLVSDQSEFYSMFGHIVSSTKGRYIRRLIILLFPYIIQLLRINLIRPKLRDFVIKIVSDTVEYRETNNVKRNDFLDLLINIKQNKEGSQDGFGTSEESSKVNNKAGFTLEQMASQTFLFIVAGFETASSLMAFCLFELSCHQNIQEQLHKEIQEAVDNNGGKISYQVLMDIPLLDQVINETLRLYGSAHVLSRICTESYKVPDSDLTIEKGMKVIIPLFSLHHDQEYYPDPYEFKPDRFTPEEIKKRHPCVFMPFGEGPRNCIGMRFGQMQAKVGLATVISNYQVELTPEQELPIEIDRFSVPLKPAKPVLLQFIKRNV